MKMDRKGNLYKIESDKQDRIERVFEYARDTMVSPCAFHMISHIDNEELFGITRKTLIKSFQRALKRQYKLLAQMPSKSTRRQKCPRTVIAYSIEFKYTSQKDIDGDEDAYKSIWKVTSGKLPFLHIHFYVIADCNQTIPMNFTTHAMEALNELKGLRAARYAKTKDNKKYKTLNDDYDDAVLRAFYIGKIEQKSDKIPYRNTFGTSQIN
jgi:hypothetical protein